MEDKRELSKALQGKYNLVGILPGEIVHPGVGTVDLRHATVQQAEALIAAGCTMIEKVEKTKDK